MDCVFCKIANGELDSDKVDESDNFIAFKDAQPKAPGHTLVVPKKHYVNFLEIPEYLGNELVEFTKKVAGKVMSENDVDNFNLVMNNGEGAGQIVMHAHLHVLPRKGGEVLSLP